LGQFLFAKQPDGYDDKKVNSQGAADDPHIIII